MRCARDAPTKLKDDFFRAVPIPSNIFQKESYERTNKNKKKGENKEREKHIEKRGVRASHPRQRIYSRALWNKRLDTRGRTQDVAFNAHVSKKHYTMDTL